MDRPVTEITVFSKELAMIGSDRNVGVFRNRIEQFLDYPIQIFDRVDLALT